MNMVEVWFSIPITRATCGGSLDTVAQLIRAIEPFLARWFAGIQIAPALSGITDPSSLIHFP
jgi:hypothetical protein